MEFSKMVITDVLDVVAKEITGYLLDNVETSAEADYVLDNVVLKVAVYFALMSMTKNE